MDGKGVFNFPDGRKYEGEYIDDKKHGYGTFTWPDGRKWVGQWGSGNQHGVGSHTNENGKTRQGRWENGKFVSWIGRTSVILKEPIKLFE